MRDAKSCGSLNPSNTRHRKVLAAAPVNNTGSSVLIDLTMDDEDQGESGTVCTDSDDEVIIVKDVHPISACAPQLVTKNKGATGRRPAERLSMRE